MKKTFLIGLLLLWGVSLQAARCFNKDLETIYRLLHLSTGNSCRDSSYTFHTVLQGTTIACHVSIESAIITHLGFVLFPDTLLSTPDKWVYRYIERKLLLYALTKDTAFITRDLRFNNTALRVTSSKETPAYVRYETLSNIIDSTASINVEKDSMQIRLVIKNRQGEVDFACRRNGQILMGIDKTKADSFLLQALTSTRDTAQYMPGENMGDIIPINDSVSMFCGGTYQKIFYDIYFKMNDELLYDDEYPVQSFINAVMTPGPEHMHIDVLLTHNQYAGNEMLFTNLPGLINYFKKDCGLYFGLEDDNAVLTGDVIAVNKNLNVIHVLQFKTDRTWMNSNAPTYFCTLHSFIPIDNLIAPPDSYKLHL